MTGKEMKQAAEERVKAVYPDARFCPSYLDKGMIISGTHGNYTYLGDDWGEANEAAAWIKAASRLPPAPIAGDAEKFDDNYSEAAAFAGITFSQACQFSLYMNYLLRGGPKPGCLTESQPLPSPPERGFTAEELMLELEQALGTIEFLHGCLINPKLYKYVYPDQTKVAIQRLMQIVGKRIGCIHSHTQEGCAHCEMRPHYMKVMASVDAKLKAEATQ